jgi:hypothetical protein
VKSFHTYPQANQDTATGITNHISRQPCNLTNHLKDVGHGIRQRSTIFGYLRTPLFKLSLQTLRTLFSESFLDKIRFSNPIFAHYKTHDEEYEISFRALLETLHWPAQILPQQCFVRRLRIQPLFQKRLVLNLSHPAPRIFFDWVESDDQYHGQTISFTAERDLLSEYLVLALDMPEFRASIRLPEGFGKHDYLLSLEAPTTNGLFASDMQLD